MAVLDDDAGGWLSDAVSSVGSTVRRVASVATAPASHLVGAARNIAAGRNVVDELRRAARAELGSALQAARLAAPIASTFPGLGTAAASALTIAGEIGAGHSLKDAAIAAARAAVPGGRLGQAAFDVAAGLASGKRIDSALLASARKALPNEAARAAFDVGAAAMMRRKFNPASILRAGHALNLPQLERAQLSSFLRPEANAVARALLNRPALRGAPLSAVAARLGVSARAAREGAAAAVAVARGRRVLAPSALVNSIGANATFDGALSALGSRGAAPKQGPNVRGAIRWRVLPRAVAARIAALPALRGRTASHVARMVRGGDARGLDAGGATYTVETGDWPNRIAGKLGHPNGGTALIRANPQKATTTINGVLNFKSLFKGEVLKLPSSWVGSTPAAAPPGTGVSTGGGGAVVIPVSLRTSPTDSAGIAQVQGMLAVWGQDGNPVVPKDYGLVLADYSGSSSTRYELALDSFRVWSNGARGTRLPLSGPLDDDTYSALYDWAAARAAGAGISLPVLIGVPGVPAKPGGAPVPPPPGGGPPGTGVSAPPARRPADPGLVLTIDATPGAGPGAGPAPSGGAPPAESSGAGIALAALAALALLS